MDHDSFKKPYLENIFELEELIYRFEKPFLRYILLTCIDRQVFLFEKHYFLNQQQRKLCKVKE